MDIFICMLAAVLSGLAFITNNTYPILIISPALYFMSLYGEKHPFAKGFLFGSVFYAVNSVFLTSLDLSYLDIPLFLQNILLASGFFAVASIEGIFSGIFAKAFVAVKKRTTEKSHTLIFASMWVIYEYLISLPFLDTGYPFGRISVPFGTCPALIQTASLFGPLFISFIIIYFSSSLSICIINKSMKPLIFPLLLAVINLSVSIYLYFIPEKGEPITVKCVQNGYGGYEKWLTPPPQIIDDTMAELNGADIILFSECSVPLYLNQSPFLSKLSEKAESNGITALLGGLYMTEEHLRYTSLYELPYTGNNVYHKRHPVPFGESFPILRYLSRDAYFSEIKGGKDAVVLSMYNLVPVICFDSMFSSYAREGIKMGGRLLCVSTNDSWFSKGNAAKLHLYHSVYRAIENGRYVSRSACTGISAVIDSKGNITSFIPINETGTITEEIMLLDEITPYTLWGDIPILLYGFSVIAVSLIRRRKNER